MRETDVISTVDSGMWKWHILIAEKFDEMNEIIEREREYLSRMIRILLKHLMGDGIDLGLNRKNHRGTVKHGISHTIKTEIDCGVIEIGQKAD